MRKLLVFKSLERFVLGDFWVYEGVRQNYLFKKKVKLVEKR